MEIDETLAAGAMDAALAETPQFAQYGPKMIWMPLREGGALLLRYENQPPRDLPGLWDFQNAVVKGYKRMAGIS